MSLIVDKYRIGFVYSFLAVITLAVFWQVHNFEFINYDDNRYVTENPSITKGFTFDNYCEAFTAPHFYMWHPVTSLSLLLDYQLFGLNAGRYHLVNLLFHVASALLLFTVLRKMTGAFWPSAFVAALFAIHPLNVESVVWVAERKTVLSGFFSLLTIAVYIRYVRQPGFLSYLLVVAVCSLAFMSKPTTVTLPFVLLLLDYWPLERIRRQRTEDGQQRSEGRGIVWLIIEKIPLLLLSAGLCVLTVIAQKSGSVLGLNKYLSFHIRLANALISYVSYISKMFYPANFAVFYPHPTNTIPLWKLTVSLILLAAVSAAVIYPGRRKAYLAVGWLWFIGTLVPMIGLVQAGAQAMADRYAYVSLIGIFIIVALGANDLLAGFRYRKIALGVSSAVIISVLSVCAFFQIGYWRNSQTLFEHALKVTDRNSLAHVNLGSALYSQGKLQDAINHWKDALKIDPNFPEAHNNLGVAYCDSHRWDDARKACKEAIKNKADFAAPYNNLGVAYDNLGRYNEALQSFEQAIKFDPHYSVAYDNLANILEKIGHYQEAVEVYTDVIKMTPDSAGSYNSLGVALGRLGRLSEAVNAFDESIKIEPNNIVAYNNLGTTYNRLGRFEDAVRTFKHAIQIKPQEPSTYYGLSLVYLKMGDKEAAKKEYEILKTLDTDRAKNLLALINK